jgi:hypothetical protein
MNGSCFFPLLASTRGSDFNAAWLIYAVVGVIAAVAGSFAFNRFRKIRANGHFALFRGLCRLHELDSFSKSLLRDLAAYYDIDKPVRLFMEPCWLDRAKLDNDFPADAGLVDELRAKLFG